MWRGRKGLATAGSYHACVQIIEWGKPLETREYPDPEPKGEEVLLRVEAAGVCHSDVHIWDGYFDLGGERRISLKSRGVHLPFTMGHEIAGEVAALGPRASGVEVGDKVVAYPWIGWWGMRGVPEGYFDQPFRAVSASSMSMTWKNCG
jgi:D-arabinose 1-dehydrogenase-like Zn-dependent alcohol dehydrogenase